MIKNLCRIFLLIFCTYAPLQAQEQPHFEKAVYHNKLDSLPYRLLYPLNYQPSKKYPLLVFLHGMGGRGNDNQKQLNGFPKILTTIESRQRYNCFILVPQCPSTDVWVKFPQFPKSLKATSKPTKSAQLVFALLAQLQKQLPIADRKIYVMGNSMGGEATFDFLARKPKLFAAGIPICAVADTATAKYIAPIPIWAFHGDQDDVNEVKYTRMMIESLKKQGGQPKYTEYPGVKHNSWDKAYVEPGLFDWLFSQERNKKKRR